MTNEDKLFSLIEKYIKVLEEIHKNRKVVAKVTKENKTHREEIDFIRLELKKTIEVMDFDETSLYKLFKNRYGVIDKRFHYIYKFFFKKPIDKSI